MEDVASEIASSLMLRLPGQVDDLYYLRTQGGYYYDDP